MDSRAAAMLAFANRLLVAALGARAAGEGATPPTAERAGADSVRVQTIAELLAPPDQPDISASKASEIDKLYRKLIGSPPAASSGSLSSSAFGQHRTMAPRGATGAGRGPR